MRAAKRAKRGDRPDTRRYPPGGILRRAVTRWKHHGRTMEVGICQSPDCGKLTFWWAAKKPVAFHQSCRDRMLEANMRPHGGWAKVPRSEPVRRGRGRPRQDGRLARDFLFALQHVVLDESIREIA
jgi:hypothetical protein